MANETLIQALLRAHEVKGGPKPVTISGAAAAVASLRPLLTTPTEDELYTLKAHLTNLVMAKKRPANPILVPHQPSCVHVPTRSDRIG